MPHQSRDLQTQVTPAEVGQCSRVVGVRANAVVLQVGEKAPLS
jgi:hypothetical protein